MKEQEQIVIIDSDEISLFLAKEALIPFEEAYSINYFLNIRKALLFIKDLESPYILFVCAHLLIEQEGFLSLLKEISMPSRIYLLSLTPHLDKNRIDNIEFYSFIQKPVTIGDFLKCLESSRELFS